MTILCFFYPFNWCLLYALPLSNPSPVVPFWYSPALFYLSWWLHASPEYSAFLPSPGNILPSSLHMCKRILEVDQWHERERHVCDSEDCRGHLFDKLPKKDWASKKDEKCPCCQRPRFRTVIKGGKEVIELNVSWYIDLGLEDAIRTFFADENWVEQRAKHRIVEPGSYWGSPEQERMAQFFKDNLDEWGNCDYSVECLDHSPYDLLLDWLEPYNSATYSVGVVALR